MNILLLTVVALLSSWQFQQNAATEPFDNNEWQQVTVPHDWAISGPFDRKNDLQVVAITQNGETQADTKTGRTGGLPYVGAAWYKTTFYANPQKHVELIFDGAMSEATVYINGHKALFWPYGYNSFIVDATPYLVKKKDANAPAGECLQEVRVRLENQPQSSRWYPGAGLFRKVSVAETDINGRIPVWGVHVTTPQVSATDAKVLIETVVTGKKGQTVQIGQTLNSPEGEHKQLLSEIKLTGGVDTLRQEVWVGQPQLWSPEQPNLYDLETTLFLKGREAQNEHQNVGIRSIEVKPDSGFYLNGQLRKFQGVCLHHDLGPLGAAVNVEALIHQLSMLKDMGCDAIRTSHNMPAPELVDLCDKMGFMMMLEPFDEWDIAKCNNGYHRWFNQSPDWSDKTWAELDMINMLHQYRNHPAVVMWSIGNEVPTQCDEQGYKVAKFLQNICVREDGTRPVTCGMDQVTCVLKNGFASVLQVPGLNYRTCRYQEAYDKLPQHVVLGSESASTVSSRGVYKFPVEIKPDAIYADHQASSYDVEYSSWSGLPDQDFQLADDNAWEMGQFVWTGFDYLGEPSPYDNDAWPSHSSLYGMIDLASLPKDRYYLYRSQWNKKANTLHALPHWTWPGREGEVTPVFVYTTYPAAEVFINGRSQGIRHFGMQTNVPVGQFEVASWGCPPEPSLLERYRLMWMDTKYEPGELKIVAYDKDGYAVDSIRMQTAGQPDHVEVVRANQGERTLELTGSNPTVSYFTLRVVDKDGNLCPQANNLLDFRVDNGTILGMANGDAASLDPLQPVADAAHPTFTPQHAQMHAFSGQCTVIVSSPNLSTSNIHVKLAK